MQETIISSSKQGKNVNIIAGTTIITDPVELNIVPNYDLPTAFVIRYGNNGVRPTGNNIKIYRLGYPMDLLVIVGTPVVDETLKTLTVLVQAGSPINPADKYVVEFEVENVL